MERLTRRRDHDALTGFGKTEHGNYPQAYERSVVRRMFQAQLEASPQAEIHATFTDVDDSLTRPGEEHVAEQIIAQEHGSQRPIVPVTGNHFPWMLKRIAQGESFLRLPVMATSAGTEIWVLQDDGAYVRDESYRVLLESLGYDRRALTADAAQYVERARATHPGWNVRFRHPATDMNFLAGHDMSGDTEFEPTKITFRFAPTDADFSLDACMQELVDSSAAIQSQIVVGCRVPHSSPLYDIDIVPTTKGGALLYLTRRFEQMTGRPLRAVVSGDSGNDIDMLQTALRGHEGVEGRHIAALLDGYKPEASPFAQELHRLRGGRNGSFVRHTDARGRTDRLAYVGADTGSGPQNLLRILQTLRRKERKP